jgi:hypothetical protein
MLRGLHVELRFSDTSAAGPRWENVPFMPNYVGGNSTQHAPLLGVRLVIKGASQVVHDYEIAKLMF